MQVRRADRPLTDVVADIFRNVQDMLHSELRLAQSEVRDDLLRARPAAILVAAASAGALFSGMFVLLAIFHGLRLVMPAWAASLLLGVVLALVSAMAMAAGLRRFRALSRTTRMRAHVEERVEWVKEQMR